MKIRMNLRDVMILQDELLGRFKGNGERTDYNFEENYVSKKYDLTPELLNQIRVSCLEGRFTIL